MTAPFVVLASALSAATLTMSAATVWADGGSSAPSAARLAADAHSDPQAALWASACAACHGTGGASVGGFATLAGRDAAELLALMLRQRAGQADSTIMHQHARGFSEAELARIAAVLAARPKP